VVDVPQDVQINRQIVRKRAETRLIERDPATQLCYVEVDEPDMHKPLGDADRFLRVLASEWRLENPRIEFHLLPQVQKILREGEWKVTAAVHHDEGGPVVVAFGRGCTISPAASPSTSAPPRSPAIFPRCSPAGRWRQPARRTRRSASARI
jgi:uncharacterized 2Fe-2S/4Fe-4S cluster protein (DUF4445 family)